MASAYSTPRDFGKYIKPVNTELVNFVLQSKQQKFDYNIAKVESTLAEFGNLGLVREQDKQYLVDKIQSITSQMGDIENMDWSDGGVTRQIQSGIKGAIDSKVRNDVAMSRKYTNYIEEAQRIKEEDPDKYSDVNFVMGLRNSGAEAWLNGETDKYGNLEFMPKVDYMGQMNETIQNYIKTHGTKTVERISNGDGTYTKIERETLKPETIRNLWQANMTPEMQKQMQMEADYMYGNMSPEGQQEIIKTYKENAIVEQNELKRELDKYKLLSKGLTGAEKQKAEEQIAALEARNTVLTGELNQDIPYEKAYLNYHFKGTREKLVAANAFDRQTDIELDYDAVRALKLRRDMLKSDGKTEEEIAAEQYSKVTDPFIAQDKAAQSIFERTEEGIQSSIDGFVEVMGTNPNFFDSYGIEKEAFDNKTPEEKRAFAAQKMQQFMENGVDLASKGFTTEEIKLASKYRSNKAVFDEVNTNIEKATNNIAKNSYDALIKGTREGSINLGNFVIPAIANAINSGKSFEELEPDSQNAFRVAMIDESIRNNKVDDNLKPYVLKQREDLINKIGDKNLKAQIPREELLTDTRGATGAYFRAGLNKVEGTLDTIAEGLGSILNLDKIFGEQNRAESNFREATEYNQEANRRGNSLSLFRNDENLQDLGADEFQVNGEPISAMDYITNEYKAALEVSEGIARESATKLTSTSALIINPNIKGQERVFNSASNYLAAHNSASVDDFKDSEMYMRLNPEDNTVIFSAKLSRQAAKDYSGGDLPENRMISSKPIPITEIGDMDAITNRLKTEQDEWSLNSSNKYAQNLKFSTSGFETPEQRKLAIQTASLKLPTEGALVLEQNPQSLGLTHTEMESYLEEAERETKNGEIRSLQQEFPTAYTAMTSGAGKFEVEYKSRHNQGYFADISYVVGEGKNKKVIPITTQFTGQKQLDPNRAYIEAYQTQTKIFINLLEGYMQGNTNAINILKEIERING